MANTGPGLPTAGSSMAKAKIIRPSEERGYKQILYIINTGNEYEKSRHPVLAAWCETIFIYVL